MKLALDQVVLIYGTVKCYWHRNFKKQAKREYREPRSKPTYKKNKKMDYSTNETITILLEE